MSPVDPVSPTSPMDISPSTPTATQQQFRFPAPPVISPSLHLPKLVTSFQSSGRNASELRRMSAQFQLPTPSPLSLGPTPLTAIHRRGSTPSVRHGTAINPDNLFSSTATSAPGALPPPYSDLPPVSPLASRRVPALRRQDAMEGLKGIQGEVSSPIIQQVISLPLRVSMRRSSSPQAPSAEVQAQHVEDLNEELASYATSNAPRKYRRILPKDQAGIEPQTTGVRLRSPIHKRRHRRNHSRNFSHSLPVGIRVARKPTPEQIHYARVVNHYATELVPLISVRTGEAHPDFPSSLLQYHLLTHDQLDSLARHYHQTIDAGNERWDYPYPIAWGKVWCGNNPAPTTSLSNQSRRHLVDLNTKRRRFGRFIGLKVESSPVQSPREAQEQGESLVERMEREWRESLRRVEDEHKLREKMWGRRGF